MHNLKFGKMQNNTWIYTCGRKSKTFKGMKH